MPVNAGRRVQVAAGGGMERHKKKQPAVTTRVTAGSSEVASVSETDNVAGVGREQQAFPAENPEGVVSCDANCDAISPDRVELLARAVVLVAAMGVSGVPMLEKEGPAPG